MVNVVFVAPFAFDTTLLGLILSILMSFPMAAVR